MFEVVNPTIVGKFNVKYEEKTAMDAAKKFWGELSKIVINELPKSFFSLRDDKGKMYHFKVTEEQNGGNMADYMIKQMNNVTKKSETTVAKTFDNIMTRSQKGGRKHRYNDDDDSSSSSDDELVERYNKIRLSRKRQPISYYHYIPYIYDDDSLFMPVFMYPITPYLEISGFSSAFWA
jgi:hypothetical protein